MSFPNFDEILKLFFNTVPYVFWKDLNGKYQGTNFNQVYNLGMNFIGKTIFEILEYYPEVAEKIDDIDNRVMRENITLTLEEKMPVLNGEKIYFSQKTPIHDSVGKVIGMLGFSMDITEIKQQEAILKKERDRFINIAAQVAHDIRSPAASLLMLVKYCVEIPERERIALREAAMTIQDIANNLLTQYQQTTTEQTSLHQEERQTVLASANLLQILAEKKLQYQELSVKFDYEFSQVGNFAFINIEPTAFKRMISNVINNSVDALDKKISIIMLTLDASKEWVKITIQDNGKGMSADLIDKVNNSIIVTADKEQGHGLGLTQVRETLQTSQGSLLINSKLGHGTHITLTLPRFKAPAWIAQEIKLNNDDIVIILDDDISIHRAWDAHFSAILSQNLTLQIKHFSDGVRALNYIHSLPPRDKEKISLLSDYELLKQNKNGLEIIAESGVQRAILVTSYYANKAILAQLAGTKFKMLPKQLASEIPIQIELAANSKNNTVKQVDLVLVDDNAFFTEAISLYLEATRNIKTYQNPYEFIKDLPNYSKHTRICLDNEFQLPELNGIQLATQLHAQGYTDLYILSGKDFQPIELPDYIKLVLKTDLDSISEL